MKTLDLPSDYVGQIRFTGLPLLTPEELKKAQLDLFKALIQVKRNIKQPKKNKKGYGYNYADLNDVISAINAASNGVDIAYIQQPVEAGGKAGTHNYLFNSEGAIFDFGCYLIDLSNPGAQDHGTILTYTRRYSLSAIFDIASEDDDDAQRMESKPDFYSPRQIKNLTVAYEGKQTPVAKVFKKASEGDETAKQIITAKDNTVPTKIAFRSLIQMDELINGKRKSKKQSKPETKTDSDKIKELVDGEDPYADKKVDAERTKDQQDLFSDILGG